MRFHLDTWLHLAAELDQTGYPEVLRVRGLATRTAAWQRAMLRHAKPETIARMEDLRALNRRLAALSADMPPVFEKKKRARWQASCGALGAQRDKLARTLAAAATQLGEPPARRSVGVADLQARLAPGEALVDTLRVRDRYVVWVLGSKGAVQRIDIKDADALDEHTERFAELAARAEDDADPTSFRATGTRIREQLWAPIQARLPEGTRTIHICLDAGLAALPLAATPGKSAGTHLLDDFLLVHHALPHELLAIKRATDAADGALLVGDVDYAVARQDSVQVPTQPAHTLAVIDRARRGKRFARLPETRVEVAAVRKHLGAPVTTLTGAGASEAAVLAALPGRRLLHIATHGFLHTNPRRGLKRRGAAWLGADLERHLAAGHDPMVLTGLALAGANSKAAQGTLDGILTALEVSHLDLDAVDLVVLSACETALGRPEAGEGVLGLVQGFQMAGARKVIASLWKVDDEATRILMERFYAGLTREDDPLSPAAALRAAARNLRGAKGERDRSFAAPRYWAAFVAYGR